MSLIRNLTLSDFSEKVIARNKAAKAYNASLREAGGVAVTQCLTHRHDVPVMSMDVEIVTNIEYRSAAVSKLQTRQGIVGAVCTIGSLSDRHHAKHENPVHVFTFHTNKTTESAYQAMFILCKITADNMRAVLREHAGVIKADWELAVSVPVNNNVCKAHVRDLLRRRNDAAIYAPNGIRIGTKRLTKPEATELLLAAKREYGDILTDRKLERLDILVQEYQGLRPTVKQYQKMLREKRAAANNQEEHP